VAEDPRWTTPADLAEYAYCPRAHYYRRNGTAPETPAAAAGTAYHRRRLGSERWRDEHPGLPWAVVALGALLLALAVLLGVR